MNAFSKTGKKSEEPPVKPLNANLELAVVKRERYKVDVKAMLADCEANYVRLLRLFPEIQVSTERRLGVGEQGEIVELVVLERTPYTTLISIGKAQDESAEKKRIARVEALHSPVLKVRLYHDAKLAEVVAWQRINYIQAKHDYPNEHMVQADEKFQWNHFLGDWLAHCLAHGYVVAEESMSFS